MAVICSVDNYSQNFFRHVLFLSIVIGTLATPVTCYVMIGIDTVLNLLNGAKIVYNWNYSKKENAKQTGKNTQHAQWTLNKFENT